MVGIPLMIHSLFLAIASERGSRNMERDREGRDCKKIERDGTRETRGDPESSLPAVRSVCHRQEGETPRPSQGTGLRTGNVRPRLSRCAAVKSIQIFRCDSHGQPELSSTVATTRRLVLSRCCLPGEAAKESTWYIQGRLHKSEQ